MGLKGYRLWVMGHGLWVVGQLDSTCRAPPQHTSSRQGGDGATTEARSSGPPGSDSRKSASMKWRHS
jgi:hypothetical protein